MSKKTFMATIIITAFLVSLVAGMQAVEVDMANPYYSPPFYPPAPVKDPAIIVIQNPINDTVFHSDQIQVNFTVTQPASWFQNGLNVGFINDIYCQIDGGTNGTFNVLAINPLPVIHNPQPFSIYLNATEGLHTLTVMVNAITDYDPIENVHMHVFSSISVDSTQTVTFTVAKEVETTPSTTLFPNPTSLLSPSPSLTESPTHKSTIEPAQTPNNAPQNFAPMAILDGLIIGIVVVTLLAYGARRKGWK